MKSITSSGLICLKNDLNIEFTICKIEYMLNEDESFKYIFTPYYDVINLLGDNSFEGIPGLDLTLCNEHYERNNLIPTFISERVPLPNRENFNELLEEIDMQFYDPIVYLIKNKQKYSGDNLYVIPYNNRKEIILEEIINKSNDLGIIKIILDNIAHGNKVYINKELINSSQVFNTLSFTYKKSINALSLKQRQGIDKAKENGVYKGRKPIHIDILLFKEQLELVNKGILSPKDAAKKLNISIDKYYRIKNKLQN